MASDKNRPQPVTWAQAVRDVLIASMNKGQFLLALAGLVILLLVWRMPEQELAKLVNRLLDGLENFTLVGYILFLAMLIGWVFHARYQRRIITNELDRMSEERNRLQEASLGNRVHSSGGRRS